MNWEKIIADGSDRADRWLHDNLDGYSMARVREMIKSGRVTINGRPIKKGRRVVAGDVVVVTGVPEGPVPLADTGIMLAVVYEDEDVVIVDKPAGMPTHPLSPEESGTMINAAIARRPEMREVGDHKLEPGLIHRLDTKTRGLVMLAATREAFEFMKHEMRMHRVKKVYRALVSGEFRSDSGEIKVPLAHHSKDPGLMVAATHGKKWRGEPFQALTRFQVLEKGTEASLVELELVTGVMHQLRAHLAWKGNPVLGDDRYGGHPDPDSTSYALQATRIRFTHPRTKERVDLKVEKPLSMDDLGQWDKNKS